MSWRRASCLLPIVLSCGEALFTVDVERSAETIVQRGTIVETVLADLGFEELSGLDITSDEELRNAGAEPGDIDGVFVQRMRLAVVDSPSADLSFVDRVEVFVEAPDLDRVRIASSDAFHDGVTDVDLELDDVDLTAYAVSASMTVSLDATGRRPDEDTRLRADIALEVGVTQAGACKAARS